jgi:cytochrome c oxidase subunit 2
MEVHRFEKVWIVAALVLVLLFIGTITYGAVDAGVVMVDDSGGQTNTTDPVDGENFREPGVYRTGEDEYDVYVLAQRFSYQPGTGQPIRIPAGSTVTFHVASKDVLHGFELAGTNVNTMAIPGQVATLTAEFDEPDQYGIICNEYCGEGHHEMAGEVVVVPQSEFSANTTANGTNTTANGTNTMTGDTATTTGGT